MRKEQETIAMFRFGVIAPLVCRQFETEAQKRETRAEILSKQWKHPDGSTRQVSARTLRYWLARYKKNGLDGLYDGLRKPRKNKGVCKVLSAELLEAAELLRRELPSRSVRRLIQLLKAQGFDVARVCERTLAHHLKLRGAMRKEIERGDGYFQRWEQQYANQLWQGDTAHGPYLPDPTNPSKLKKTKLIAFIDDASRLCTHAEFYFDEKLPSMIDTFSKALLKRGRPERLLLDNAFIYHSATLASMCAQLPMELGFANTGHDQESVKISHCTPRRPQGKGKIERWNRTVKDSFYPEVQRAGITTLEELNTFFHAWLDKEYHGRVHEELGMTPLERWTRDVARIHAVSAEEIRRALMLRARRRVHENTSTVLLEGEDYQVSPPYAGKMVEVRWHPDRLQEIEIWLDGAFVEIAQRIERKAEVVRMKEPDDRCDYSPLNSSKTYFRSLTSTVNPAISLLRNEEMLSLEEFTALFAEILFRQMTESEQIRLREFFMRFSPLKNATVRQALEQAVDAKGPSLHLRFYLQHLEQVTQRNRR